MHGTARRGTNEGLKLTRHDKRLVAYNGRVALSRDILPGIYDSVWGLDNQPLQTQAPITVLPLTDFCPEDWPPAMGALSFVVKCFYG